MREFRHHPSGKTGGRFAQRLIVQYAIDQLFEMLWIVRSVHRHIVQSNAKSAALKTLASAARPRRMSVFTLESEICSRLAISS